MREVGAALDDGYKQGVLPQRPAREPAMRY